MAIRQNTTTYQPPKSLTKFETDLSSLMMFIAEQNDVVVASKPDEKFINSWEKCGIIVPKFCTKNEAKNLIHKGSKLKPWGYSKSIFHQLDDKQNEIHFDEKMRQFLSRATSIKFENELNNKLPQYAHNDFTAQIISDFGLAEMLIKKSNCVIKSLWSSSGRGVIIVNSPQHIQNALIWAKDKIIHDGSFIIEPLLKRKAEFSFLFEINNQEINYLGRNNFISDISGRFGEELIGIDETTHLNLPLNWEKEISDKICETMKQNKFPERYNGYVGFDAMAYEEANTIKIRPTMEINLRTCMGNINKRISKCFGENIKAKWHIDHFKKEGEWDEFWQKKEAQNALLYNNDGLIIKGFFRLTPQGKQITFAAWGETID